MLKWGFGTALVFASLLLCLVFLNSQTQSIIPNNTLTISQIKARNDTAPGGLNEFIELYNNTGQAIQLSQYQLVYFNVYNPPTAQTPTSTRTLSDTLLAPSSFYLLARDTNQLAGSVSLSPISSLKDDQGVVRLLGPDADNPGQTKVYDEIAWLDSSSLPDGVYKVPINSKSLHRYTKQTDLPILFENDWLGDTPSPGSILYVPPAITEDEPAGLTCEGIVINEVLPNPAGADSGNEYIELFNPTNEVIPLKDCSLQTSANQKTYDFGTVELQPNQYFAFYDSQTGLTLPNSAGGTVWLLTPTEEIQAIAYQTNLADDVAWASFSGGWQPTYQPTPNAANVLVLAKPCPAGQTRSLDTNRCRSLLSSYSTGLKPCLEGQERNPLTNRCRLTNGTTRQLAPCQPGQERNPVTNRCRKIAASSLKPCAPGQTRNPETNRCKKRPAGQVAGLTTVKDVDSGGGSVPIHWGVAGFVSLGALGYGVYEWRQDILNAISRLRKRV